MSSTAKSVFFWFILLVVVVLLWQSIKSGGDDDWQEISYNRFRELVEGGEVVRLAFVERRVRGVLTDGGQFRLVLPFAPDAELVDALVEAGVEVYGGRERENTVLAIFLTWGPVLLIVGLWVFFMRQFRAQSADSRCSQPPADDRAAEPYDGS